MQDNLAIIIWVGIILLVFGSVYLIFEGIKVHQIFAESIVGRLVKTLVVVLLIELYSLGLVSFAYIKFYPKGIVFMLPIVFLWIVGLLYSIFAIRGAKRQVFGLINKK